MNIFSSLTSIPLKTIFTNVQFIMQICFFIILFTFTISVVFITFTYLMTSTCNDERGKENGMDTLFYHIFSLFIPISPQEHRRRLVRIISVW